MEKIHKKRDNIKKKDNKTNKQPNICTQIETFITRLTWGML